MSVWSEMSGHLVLGTGTLGTGTSQTALSLKKIVSKACGGVEHHLSAERNSINTLTFALTIREGGSVAVKIMNEILDKLSQRCHHYDVETNVRYIK